MDILYNKELPRFKIKNTVCYKDRLNERIKTPKFNLSLVDSENLKNKKYFLKRPTKNFLANELILSGSPSIINTLTTTSLTSRDLKNDLEKKLLEEMKLHESTTSTNRSISYSISQNAKIHNISKNSIISSRKNLSQIDLNKNNEKLNDIRSLNGQSFKGKKTKNQGNKVSLDAKTNQFFHYLENLNPEPKIYNSPKKKLQILKSHINQIASADINSSKQNIIKIKKGMASKNEEILQNKRNSIVLKNNKINNIIGMRKGASIIMIKKNKNYEMIIDLFNRTCENIRNFEKIVSNEYKAYFLLRSFIKDKQKYLNEFFFAEGKEKLISNISPSHLEKFCFKKEIIKNKNATSLLEELLINANLPDDMKEINEKIENYLIKRYLNEMKYLEENLKNNIYQNVTTQYKNGDIFINKFNYEQMSEESIIDELYKVEKNFGQLQYMTEKERIVGKSIDNLIKNAKFLSEQRGYIFRLMD